MKIDSIDSEIIRLLAHNGSLTATEIAKTIHLSIQSVTKRIEKIVSSGLIERYTVVVNPALAGKPVLALISLILSNPSYLDKLQKKINGMDDVLSFCAITGEYDYAIVMCAPTVEELNKQLIEIKMLPGVQKSATSFVLQTYKKYEGIIPVVNKQ